MNILLDELQELLQIRNENERIEFKEAKVEFSIEKLAKYCAALSNEGGGKLILGVTDKKPRMIVGTQAFVDLNRCKLTLTQKLRLRIEVQEMECSQGRILVFHAPPRPRGDAIEYEGAYWMRAGESLVAMTKDMLKRIFAETDPDFSEQICKGATIDHLDHEAIEKLRSLWLRKSGNEALAHLPILQLLSDAELVNREGVTYAALILLGKNQALKLGLDRETNKELLLKHIVAHKQIGSRLQELMQVLPMLSKDQVQKLVKELKLQDLIYNKGTTRSALWYPVPIAPK